MPYAASAPPSLVCELRDALRASVARYSPLTGGVCFNQFRFIRFAQLIRIFNRAGLLRPGFQAPDSGLFAERLHVLKMRP
jgi:hypothetical protein